MTSLSPPASCLQESVTINANARTVPLRTWAESQIPSLNGLRAVSIAMVMFSHCIGTNGFPLESHHAIGDFGALGVRVFFVISGFLITSLLLQELHATSRINLLLFYARRSVRIFPACYLFIATMGVLQAMGFVKLRPYDLVHAATYTMNHHPDHGWHLGHLWSLAVEEQFYLAWPFVLALFGVRRGLWVAAAAIGLCPLIRLGMIYVVGTYVGINRIFPAVADSLATGCLLAGVRGWCEANSRYMSILGSKSFWVLPIGIILLNVLLKGRPTIMSAAGATVLNLSIAICIHHWVVYPADRVGVVLNSRCFVTAGVLSYSLYLWQQLFLNRASDAWLNSFSWNVIFTCAAAWASYRFVEQPLMRLRKRLAAY